MVFTGVGFWVYGVHGDRRAPGAALGGVAAPQAQRARHCADERQGTPAAPGRVLADACAGSAARVRLDARGRDPSRGRARAGTAGTTARLVCLPARWCTQSDLAIHLD